ncbi:MAG: ABC transporter transmembrane domain-containing protein [Hyphomicrobiales bacterium]
MTAKHKNTPTSLTANDNSKRPVLTPLRMLIPYIFQDKRLVVAALISLLVASAATLTVPVALRRVVANGFSGENVDTIDYYFIAMIGVVAVLALASAARYYFVTQIGERTVADIRKDVFAAVLKFDAAYFDSARTGEVISRLTADTTQIKSAVGSTASVALRNILLFIGAIIMMVYTSPQLSGLIVFAIPLIVLPLIAFGRLVRRRSRAAQDKLADASAYATEMAGSVHTIQSLSAGEGVQSVFSSTVDASYQAARNAIKTRAFLTLILIFLIFASIVSILWAGARSVIEGDMAPGMLVQFLLYAVFAAGAMGSLSEVWGEMQQTAGATERLMELVAEEPQITVPENPVPISAGAINVDGVQFAYPGVPDKTIVSDLSFTVEPGETVAIVGPSGAGKSTIFQLLTRFYDPTNGAVHLGGSDIKQADPDALRSLFAVVPQDPVIFNGDITGNISFGAKGNVDDAAIVKAAKVARADIFIDEMEGGYHARVGERGITLSGGQKQRLAIARAVLRDAPILLLDEATSALDAESEAHVQAALEDLMKGRTTLIIAHRLATILKADRILVMDEGRIVEQGTHASLVKKGGLYARLAKLQFESDVLVRPAAE